MFKRGETIRMKPELQRFPKRPTGWSTARRERGEGGPFFPESRPKVSMIYGSTVDPRGGGGGVVLAKSIKAKKQGENTEARNSFVST